MLASVSIATFDVEAVRRRYSALQRDLALLDGPGGTQVPDKVVDAISAYLRQSNSNVGGPFETSERTVRVVDAAREAAGPPPGCSPDEVTFGANMTSLCFALSRTAGRSFEPGDEIVVTRLDHDGNVAPWLELAHDLGLEVRFADITDECDVDLADLEAQLSPAHPRRSLPGRVERCRHADRRPEDRRVGPRRRRACLADAVHAAPHVPTDVASSGSRRPRLLAV